MYLFRLRENWRAHTAPNRMTESHASIFLRQHGAKCVFKNVGLDSSGGRNPSYNGTIYAVFNLDKNNLNQILPVTVLDLKLIEETMKWLPYGPAREGIINNMTVQIKAAKEAIRVHTPLITELCTGAAIRQQIA